MAGALPVIAPLHPNHLIRTRSAARVKSAAGVELFLNLAWAAVSVCMLCLWLRFAPRTGPDRRIQFVALAMIILILLPVISVTDDLQAARNPAEVDTCLRRDHDWSSPHSIVPAVAVLPLLVIASLDVRVRRTALPGSQPLAAPANPFLAPVENRPPPAA